MKVSDYIVEYFIQKGITDVFGYPGGMVTHLMDSFGKYKDKIHTHIAYHEQGASFAACGYAQASGKAGVAFATSGPGATNLLTGVCNAYFDSIPVIFITGQVNTFEAKGEMNMRQRGFQETDIVSMASPVTKKAVYVDNAADIKRVLDDAFDVALSGRKGPVLIDIPMNVFRTEVEEYELSYEKNNTKPDDSLQKEYHRFESCIADELKNAKRPCLLLGNGIKIAGMVEQIRELVRKSPLPVVSSMLAVDVIPEEMGLEGIYYGFVGAYGNRTANFVAAKCDLIICLGSRLDVRQVGGKRENFAPQARIVRVDIDENELENRIRREDEIQFKIPLAAAITGLENALKNGKKYDEWIDVCREIKERVKYIDEKEPNRIVNAISKRVPADYSVVADVGQNMVWVAQSFKMKEKHRLYLSGGHGAMGYALPAAIGIYYATHRPVICFNGDGGIQMNIQELQFIARENLPIKVVILNNLSLGMIRHFQEMYFESNYYYTVKNEGYTVPDFRKIAQAYGIESQRILGIDEIEKIQLEDSNPMVYEVILSDDTVVSPKLEFGKPNQDQEPLLDRELYKYLMDL